MFRFLLLFALALPVLAQAQTVVFGPRGERATAYRLTTLTSDEGESKEAFLGRVGRFMTNYTQNNTFEACASICKANASPASTKWAVVVHSNESVLACAAVSVCPDGMADTNEVIHSHPVMGQYPITRTDEAFLRARNERQKVGRQFAVREYSGFSAIDKERGKGYLVENEQLLYFDGSTTTQLGPVAATVFNKPLAGN